MATELKKQTPPLIDNGKAKKQAKPSRKFGQNVIKHLCKTRTVDDEGYTMFVKQAEKKLEKDSFIGIVKGSGKLPTFKFHESVLFHIMKLHVPKFNLDGIFSGRKYEAEEAYIDPYVTYKDKN